MALALLGTLPVSNLNVGLGASGVSITAELERIGLDLSKLTASLQAQASFSANFPPNIPGFAAQFAAALNPAALASAFLPANWVTVNAGANASLALDLGIIEAQLALLSPVALELELGASASDLTGWSYAGRADGFGRLLEAATSSGFRSAPASANCNAIIIATNLFTSWQAFSLGFSVGESSSTELEGATTDLERLQSLGTLSGSDWNIGVKGVIPGVTLILKGLEGARLQIKSQIQVSLGVNLPNVQLVVDAGLKVDLGAALAGMINIQTDLAAGISGLEAKIAALLALRADLDLQLQAGGLTAWSYSGPAGELGSCLRTALEDDGLPGTVGGPREPIYGVAVASANNAAWAAFGSIFRTA